MANRYYNPWAGLPQIGARIGGAIQQKGALEQQSLLARIQQEQEKTSPQYQLTLERLKKMRDDVTAAEKIVKGKEAEATLARQWSQFFVDKESPGYVSSKEYTGFSQLLEKLNASGATTGKYQKDYTSQPHREAGMTYQEHKRYQGQLRAKEVRLPAGAGPKEPSVAEDIKLYDRAKSFLLGSPFDVYEVKDKKGKPTGEIKRIPGSGVKGFLEEVGLPKGELPMGPFLPDRDPIQRMWQKWDKRKSELSPKVKGIVENILVDKFGPREEIIKPRETISKSTKVQPNQTQQVYLKLQGQYGRETVENAIKVLMQKNHSRNQAIQYLHLESGGG